MASLLKSRKARVLLAVLVVLLVTGIVFGHTIALHLRAMSFLLRFSDPNTNGFSVRFAQHPVREEAGTAETALGPLNYRMYIPQDVAHPGGMVIAPGVHYLGLAHPGLISLSRALAHAGVEVMDVELRDLADYHITPRTIDMIGTAAGVLSDRMNHEQVGVLGLSFAGGLALMAASRPEYSGKIGFVFAIGAHDEMTRVARFYATNNMENLDGSTTPFPAHEYGALILAYTHLEDFFPPADVPIAQKALRQWLTEQPEATKTSEEMSPAGRAEWDLLLHHRDQLRQKFLDEIKLHSDEMRAVSPHGNISNLSVPVFLLHGAGDNVIPASECAWLAHDVPAKDLREMLVSPALIHVKLGDTVTLKQKWQLVDFMAKVLDSTDKLARTGSP
jgi:pimeloyl-ACP methyl ester carboxylesterase